MQVEKYTSLSKVEKLGVRAKAERYTKRSKEKLRLQRPGAHRTRRQEKPGGGQGHKEAEALRQKERRRCRRQQWWVEKRQREPSGLNRHPLEKAPRETKYLHLNNSPVL